MAEPVFLSEILAYPAFFDAAGHAVDIRYAPEGAAVANVYYTNGFTAPYSLGQLVTAVMLRSAAASEARAIFKLNVLNDATSKQKMASYVDRLVCDGLLAQVEEKWSATDTPAAPSLNLEGKDMDLSGKIREYLYHPKTKEFADNPNAYTYLKYECGLSDVAAQLKGYDDFINLHERMRPAMEESTRSSAITQVELQSAVGRRDVAYTTSANIVKAITVSLTGTAAALRI